MGGVVMTDEYEEMIKLGITLVSFAAIVAFVLQMLVIIQNQGFDFSLIIEKLYPYLIAAVPTILSIIKFVFKLLDIADVPLKLFDISKSVLSLVKHKENKALLEWDEDKARFK